ncbi:MAG: chitobiase/beta-hexosaminidase C-terminal domain-containing protein [Bacteroidales bacterium]|nr:chitobiase/beta-hexosaminidase C-terminal domain-containing protein [Bacteroidales bacterium]
MKRPFTLLMTAVLLLIGNLGWAQTRTEVTDVLNRELTGVSGTTYTSWSDKTSNSDAVYAGQSAGGNESIQLRSNNNNSGIITTASGGTVSSVSVVWNSNTLDGRTLNIYGSHTAYTSPTELYDESTQGTLLGTIVKGTNNELIINDTYEFIGMRSASYAMYLTEIDIIWTDGEGPAIATPTFSPAGGTYTEAQTVTISCETPGVTIYYTTDGSNPDDESTVYRNPITVSVTTTIKAIAFDSNDNTSYVGTATYNIVNPDAPGSESNPYTVAQARAAIDAGTGLTNVYVHGIVSEIVTAFSPQHGNISYNISDDGTTSSDQLQAYRGKGLNGENFTSADDIMVGDIVTIFGNLTLYNNSVYELAANNYLVSIVHNQTMVTTPTFNPAAGNYTGAQTVEISCSTEGATIYYSTSSETGPWTVYSAPITVSTSSTLWAYATKQGLTDSQVASAQYTITEPAAAQIFTRVNGHAVEEDQVYLIVDITSGRALTAVNGASSAPTAVEVTIDENNQIVTDDINLQWNFESTEGGYIIYTAADHEKWLYSTDGNNGVRIGTNENNVWELDIADGESYHGFKNVPLGRYLGVYNNQDWRAYTTINNNIKNTQIELFVLGDEQYQDPPTITANDVEIDYNITSGRIPYTIDNAVTGGTLTATVTDGDWLTLGMVSSNAVSFTTTANTEAASRTATVTLTYTYNRLTVIKNVTVTQAGNPNIINTISEITANGNYTVQGTIVAINTRGFIVGDGTGYVYYFFGSNFDSSGYTVGDIVKLDGSVVTYGGVFEFNNSTTVTAAESSNYNAEDPTVITGEEMDARVASTTPAQLSSYVQYEGTLTISGTHYNINGIDGASTAIGSISYPLDTEFTSMDGSLVRVTGYFVGISSSTYYNTMIGTIEEIGGGTPVINANDITIPYNAAGGEIPYTVSHAVTGNTLTATSTTSWISNISVSNDKVSFTTTVNNDDADRTGTITLAYPGAANKVVTVTQQHYVIDYAELPFSFDGGRADIDTVAGLTYSGLGTDYANSPKLKFDGTGDWLMLKFNGEPINMKFDIKGNSFSDGTFTVQTSVDGETFTELESFTELGSTTTKTYTNLNANIRYIKWIYTERVNGNVALGNIIINDDDIPTPIEINPTHTLATSIVSGRHYIIVGLKGNEAYAMGMQNTNNRVAVGITLGDGVVEVGADAAVYEFIINGPDANGNYIIYDTNEASTGYLYAASSSSNNLKTRDFNSDGNSQWAITFGENNNANIIAQGDNERNIMRFNNSGNGLFSCYATGQQDIYLYVKDTETAHEFVTDVAGYGEENNHWQLIASPVAGQTNPQSVVNMLAENYDLYRFNLANSGEEWRNYKKQTFNLTKGNGYLYANAEGTVLRFAGQPNTSGNVTLSYTTTQGNEHNGWNLIGNPFGQAAYLSDGRSFYVVNEEGTEVILAETTAINAMQGIFVVAQNSNDRSVTFTTTPSKAKTMAINLSQDNQLIDRAVVRFDKDERLGKLLINKESSAIFFTEDEQDLAVINAEGRNEIPVNFKANEDGEYCLTIKLNGVEMHNLRLVDKLTGESIDLMRNSSYRFKATADEPSGRFVILFNEKK